MTELERALRRIAGDLDRRSMSWCLVGGLAVGTRAEPRTTRDVDIAVAVVDDAEAEQLIAELRGEGYEIATVLEHQVLSRLATVRLVSRGAALPVTVDLLFASTGIERDICAAAERLELVPGLAVPVAQTGHLIAMKLLARDDRTRPQDYDDLRALLRHGGDRAVATAREAIARIQEIGAGRGRDLSAALLELLSD